MAPTHLRGTTAATAHFLRRPYPVRPELGPQQAASTIPGQPRSGPQASLGASPDHASILDGLLPRPALASKGHTHRTTLPRVVSQLYLVPVTELVHASVSPSVNGLRIVPLLWGCQENWVTTRARSLLVQTPSRGCVGSWAPVDLPCLYPSAHLGSREVSWDPRLMALYPAL